MPKMFSDLHEPMQHNEHVADGREQVEHDDRPASDSVVVNCGPGCPHGITAMIRTGVHKVIRPCPPFHRTLIGPEVVDFFQSHFSWRDDVLAFVAAKRPMICVVVGNLCIHIEESSLLWSVTGRRGGERTGVTTCIQPPVMKIRQRMLEGAFAGRIRQATLSQ